MDINGIPLFSTLKSRLGYLSQRQTLISQNVANINSPGFVGKDLKPFVIPDKSSTAGRLQLTGPSAAVGPARTNASHMQGTVPSTGGQGKPQNAPDSETRLDGNKVVLEEQMMKMTDARMNYDAAVTFYQKSLGLLRMAAKAPGR
jgi:flagellar basal-body rod protein FlgB